VELLNPQSTGSVTIQSGNPFQIAAADDGFYQNPVDLQNMKSAVEVYIRNLLNQLALIAFPLEVLTSDEVARCELLTGAILHP
jgi:hypothetical protein